MLQNFSCTFLGGRACHIRDNKIQEKKEIEYELTCEYEEIRLVRERIQHKPNLSHHFKNTHGVQRTEPLQKHIGNKQFFKPLKTTWEPKELNHDKSAFTTKQTSKRNFKTTLGTQFYNNKSAFLIKETDESQWCKSKKTEKGSQ